MELKYNWWELWFSDFKFIRRLSKSYWVKQEGNCWVKFTDYELKNMTAVGIDLKNCPLLIVEDYRRNK